MSPLMSGVNEKANAAELPIAAATATAPKNKASTGEKKSKDESHDEVIQTTLEELLRKKDLNFIVAKHKRVAELVLEMEDLCYSPTYLQKHSQTAKTVLAFLERYEATPFYDVREAMELAKPRDKGGLLAEAFMLDIQHPVDKKFYASRLSLVRVLKKKGSRRYVSRMAANPEWLAIMVTMGYTWTEMFYAFNHESFHGFEDLNRYCRDRSTGQKPIRRPTGTAFLRAKATTVSTQSYSRTTTTSDTTSNMPPRSLSCRHVAMSPCIPCRPHVASDPCHVAMSHPAVQMTPPSVSMVPVAKTKPESLCSLFAPLSDLKHPSSQKRTRTKKKNKKEEDSFILGGDYENLILDIQDFPLPAERESMRSAATCTKFTNPISHNKDKAARVEKHFKQRFDKYELDKPSFRFPLFECGGNLQPSERIFTDIVMRRLAAKQYMSDAFVRYLHVALTLPLDP
jgi:predicted nucleotide-binding protein